MASESASAFDIEIDTEELEAALLKVRPREDQIARIMGLAAEELVAAVGKEFDTAGHGEWPPRSVGGVVSKAMKSWNALSGKKQQALSADPMQMALWANKAAGQLLVDTGRLKGSIRGAHGPEYAEAATDVSYAVYHISKAPRTIIPLRNFFDIEEDTLKRIMDNVVTRITQLINTT